MGSTRWSDDHYTDRVNLRAAKGVATFAYDAGVHAAAAAGDTAAVKAHKTLDPHGVKMRECRDSAAHPNSRPVITILDQTGSMQIMPQIAQKNLCKLMGLILRNSYLDDPAIMTCGVGDAYSDRVPLQVGQFESGIEIENDLTNLFLEGNGGGQNKESYDLALYFAARHTVSDAWEKRQEKGYIFLIADEMYYPQVNKQQVAAIIGDGLEADIPTEQIVKELQEKWHIYYVMPKVAHHFGDRVILNGWKKLLGENVILLEDPEGLAQCIATQIGIVEGKVDVDGAVDDMVAAGTDKMLASKVGRALVPAGAGGKATGTAIDVPDSGGGSGIANL